MTIHNSNKQDLLQKSPDSYVYFARGERSKLIKIGVSKDPNGRLKELIVGSERVTIIFTTPGSFHLERKFHTRFKVCREHGEWFREEGPLYKFLVDKHLEWQEPIEANSVPSTIALGGHIRGFCITNEGKEALLKCGFTDQYIFQQGDGAETLSACLATFRGRPGWVIIPGDGREFGTNKKEVSETVALLERMKIRILSTAHLEDTTYAQIIQRANVAISSLRFRDHRVAKRVGRWGGKGKGIASEARRNALMAADIVRRLCAHPKLTFNECAAILGPPFSPSTLRRHYSS